MNIKKMQRGAINRRRKGITLVEMLTVIAIISILMAMTLPAVQKAREKSKYIRWIGYKDNLRCEPSLVAYYTFEQEFTDKLENKTVGDPSYIAASKNGVIYGANWLENGGRWMGKFALEFDGLSDYVDCGSDSTFLMGAGNFTVEVWAKRSSVGQIGWIVCKGSINTNGLRYGLKFTSDDKITFEIDDDSTKQDLASSETIRNDRWYYFAGVRVLSESGNEYMRLYVNGEEDPNSPLDITGYGLLDNDRPCYIGACYDEDVSGRNEELDGVIGEVAIYNRALSADEIRRHYKMGRP